MLRQIAEFVAVLSCSLFTGASVYINLVEHPARMQCGVEIAATEFAPSYRRATVLQATSAAVGLISSIVVWLAGATFWWLVAGALLESVIPFTLLVILPTNKVLLSPKLDRRSVEAERLLARWGALHAVRSVLSGMALLLLACCSSRCTACSKLTRVAGWTGSPSRKRCTGCWDFPDSRMSCRNPKRLALAMVPASAARVFTL
jgi:hypothetical protein